MIQDYYDKIPVNRVLTLDYPDVLEEYKDAADDPNYNADAVRLRFCYNSDFLFYSSEVGHDTSENPIAWGIENDRVEIIPSIASAKALATDYNIITSKVVIYMYNNTLFRDRSNERSIDQSRDAENISVQRDGISIRTTIEAPTHVITIGIFYRAIATDFIIRVI